MFNTFSRWKFGLFMLLLLTGGFSVHFMPVLACVNVFLAGVLAQEMLSSSLWEKFREFWCEDKEGAIRYLEKRMGVVSIPPRVSLGKATFCCAKCSEVANKLPE